MQRLYNDLVGLGARDDRIRFEAFGSAQVTLKPDPTRSGAATGEAVTINFAKSGKTAMWWPEQGSLLDLAEQVGAAPLSSCRSGVCGSRATRVLRGDVDFPETPAHEVAPGEALICVARPRAGPHLDGSLDREGITLDL